MPVNIARIRQLRDQRMLTQREAAERAGWKGLAGMIKWQEIEKGKYANPGILFVQAVAAVLNCSVDELLTPLVKEDHKTRRPSSAAGSKALPSASTAKVKATSMRPPAKSTSRTQSSH